MNYKPCASFWKDSLLSSAAVVGVLETVVIAMAKFLDRKSDCILDFLNLVEKPRALSVF
jgi:hypothetical protein